MTDVQSSSSTSSSSTLGSALSTSSPVLSSPPFTSTSPVAGVMTIISLVPAWTTNVVSTSTLSVSTKTPTDTALPTLIAVNANIRRTDILIYIILGIVGLLFFTSLFLLMCLWHRRRRRAQRSSRNKSKSITKDAITLETKRASVYLETERRPSTSVANTQDLSNVVTQVAPRKVPSRPNRSSRILSPNVSASTELPESSADTYSNLAKSRPLPRKALLNPGTTSQQHTYPVDPYPKPPLPPQSISRPLIYEVMTPPRTPPIQNMPTINVQNYTPPAQNNETYSPWSATSETPIMQDIASNSESFVHPLARVRYPRAPNITPTPQFAQNHWHPRMPTQHNHPAPRLQDNSNIEYEVMQAMSSPTVEEERLGPEVGIERLGIAYLRRSSGYSQSLEGAGFQNQFEDVEEESGDRGSLGPYEHRRASSEILPKDGGNCI